LKEHEVNMQITIAEIARKRVVVNRAYYAHGFHSPEYQGSFDELHDMNMLIMADQFRRERGLPPASRTPYCPTLPRNACAS
jgi:hypothetical protein